VSSAQAPNKPVLLKVLSAIAALAVITNTALLTRPAVAQDAISQAERKDGRRGSIAETKVIAEEGFIYGLPLVMSYAIMYASSIDNSTDQFKAPINQIKNETRECPARC
jgi:hypothetical protein